MKFNRPRRIQGNLAVILTLLLGACAPAAPSATPTAAATQPPLPSATALPTATLSPSATPIPSATPLPPLQVCSPLEGLTLAELPEILTQPFLMPRPGWDEGHQGTDFAYYRRGERIGMTGLPVYSVLNGRVAASLTSNTIYGNLVVIETPLNLLPADWVAKLQLPEPVPTVVPPSLVCPTETAPTAWETNPQRSLYLAYGHLNLPSALQTGQTVQCGQAIGEVGSTGRSSDAHLHLEVRVGPSGAQFASLDHYTAAASDEARRNYCTWRVSGLFQLQDPMRLISTQP